VLAPGIEEFSAAHNARALREILDRSGANAVIAEDAPLFRATYDWLHSPNYRYSFSASRYGLPGSYRLPITTSWMIADELLLQRSRDRAETILLASPWDGGIVSEGIDPETARMDYAGRAFATAAGYVAHAICATACRKP
jgi:hypothetical protein